MFETGLITFILLIIVSAAIAAWPVVFAPAFRTARTYLTGSCCLSLGTGIITLAAWLLPAATFTANVLADDKDVSALKAEADPIIGDHAIQIPAGRPDWIGQQPSSSGKIHTISIASGPYATNRESLQALDDAIVKATKEYIAEQLNSDLAAQLITYDARTIKRNFVKDDTYHDEATYSVGKMHENFARLQFDQKFRTEIGRRWNQVRASGRLLQTGVFAGASLLVVASIFGYFRTDHVTRGHYNRRLQFLAATALITIAATATLALRFIPRL
ncbi:MAG TPA: hypothetical protein VGI40_23240 [Pirellulaceae bacterium]|jgi:hypothetical protein